MQKLKRQRIHKTYVMSLWIAKPQKPSLAEPIRPFEGMSGVKRTLRWDLHRPTRCTTAVYT